MVLTKDLASTWTRRRTKPRPTACTRRRTSRTSPTWRSRTSWSGWPTPPPPGGPARHALGEDCRAGPDPPGDPAVPRRGRWYARQLKRLDYAIRFTPPSWATLTRPTFDALLFLADAYRDMKQWPALVQTLTRSIEVVDDPQRKKNILVQLGQTHEEILQDERRRRPPTARRWTLTPTSPARWRRWTGCTARPSGGRTWCRSWSGASASSRTRCGWSS